MAESIPTCGPQALVADIEVNILRQSRGLTGAPIRYKPGHALTADPGPLENRLAKWSFPGSPTASLARQTLIPPVGPTLFLHRNML